MIKNVNAYIWGVPHPSHLNLKENDYWSRIYDRPKPDSSNIKQNEWYWKMPKKVFGRDTSIDAGYSRANQFFATGSIWHYVREEL